MSYVVDEIPIVIVGCGYAADFYLACLAVHPELTVVGAYDQDEERLRSFVEHHGLKPFSSLGEALAADALVVANLTTIAAHYLVTRVALEAGKHAFSEKPLAATFAQACELREIAADRGLVVASAPSTGYGPCAGAVREALRTHRIGRPLLVHAALDDGAVYFMEHENWVSPSGRVWPAAEEFAAGPVLEHAGYQLSWLIDLFGSVVEMAGSTKTLIPDGVEGYDTFGANAAQWALVHDSGVVSRVSCSGLAPRDYSLTIVGESGVLHVHDVMRLDSEVTCRQVRPEARSSRLGYLTDAEPISYDCGPPPYLDTHYVDFAAGLARLAHHAAGHRDETAAMSMALHVLELTLVMAEPGTRSYLPTTAYRR